MKNIVKYIFFFISVVLLVYLSLADIDYPKPISNSLRSIEPADTEDINRRGYFVNQTRNEVIYFYQKSLKNAFFNITPIKLNYPPEEAQNIIRDQTRSTYLEELVYPMRESLFVNGFEPQEDSEKIIVSNQLYHQKITVKKISSPRLVRIAVGMVAMWLFYHLLVSWGYFIGKLKETGLKKLR